MNFATVCSGIGAPEAAWKPLGWKCLFQSEIEQFPSAVLKHHYPDVPNLGDMEKYKEWPDYDLSNGVICAGTPCQAFSVAGLRKGLDDPRGNLTLVFLGIIRRYRPWWVVWENVPGVLSDKTGAFGAFLGGLGQLGYGFAYRILDAQYFGVPQRRRRIFVVGCLGGWQCAAAVLFERHSLQGHTPPSRQAGQGFAADLAPSLTSSGRGVERTGESRGQDPVIAHSLGSDGFDANKDDTGRETPLVMAHGQGNAEIVRDGSPSLTCNHEQPICFHGTQDTCVSDIAFAQGRNNGQENVIAIAQNQRGEVREMEQCPSLSVGGGKPGRGYPAIAFQTKQSSTSQSPSYGEITPPLDVGKAGGIATKNGMRVRRLTPRECERLQGFPDDYTLVEYRGKPASDGPRYKALGNSMAVPVVRWIGKRIKMVQGIKL
jgi:DNA (cytosine-5)-methyltransferase 1